MMEKRIVIMRHAEAEEPTFQTNDFQRKLTTKGILTAKKVANSLQLLLIPDCILTSDARRTLQTTELLLENFTGHSISVIEDNSLYLASALLMQQKIVSLEENINTAVIVAHNPGVSELVFELTGEYVSMLPATAVIIRLPISSWKLLTNRIGILEKVISP